MSEMHCTKWVHATANVHVRDILYVAPLEACFVGGVHGCLRRDLYHVVEGTGKILEAAENRADMDSLYPLPAAKLSCTPHIRNQYTTNAGTEISVYATQHAIFNTKC
jgi:hypothetical protein